MPYYKDVIPNVSNDIKIIIPSIHLDVYTSYESTLKEGLEIHPLSSKPGYKNTTLIISGHAGFGKNVYFNHLIELKKGNEIIIDDFTYQYHYIIEEKEIVQKGNKYSFTFNENYLYLITCYKLDKQVIIKAKMT